MSGIRAKILSVSPDLSKAELRVAKFISENADRVPFLSVHALADAAGVSVASVSRFVKKAGFSNFKDFKVGLAREGGAHIHDMYRAITTDDTDDAIVRKVFKGYELSIEDTLSMLDVPALIEVSGVLSACRRVIFFGIGGSGIVAQDAALRFSHLDIQTESYSDPLSIIIQVKRLQPGDAAFGISHSGRTKVTCEALQVANKNGVFTCGISNYIRSPLSRHARFLFCTAFPEDRVKVAALSSRIAQLCVIDALYLLTAKHKEQVWDTEDLNRLIEQLLRLK
jgi:RpiR family carbohydrate utilization transcriptional regulator